MYYAEPPASYTFKDPDELADGNKTLHSKLKWLGKVEIWIVRDALKEEWPTEKYGQFWSKHSFIVLVRNLSLKILVVDR